MNTLLEKFCNDREKRNGLMLIDMPTGLGKTHAVAEYIANNYQNIKGKILFITQLKKNLPEEELRKSFSKIGKAAILDSLLLKVENNLDNLCYNFLSVEKELFKYIKDTQLLRKIKREVTIIQDNHITEENMLFIQQARDDLKETSEKALRIHIENYLSFDHEGQRRTKQQKEDLICNDPDYSWIGKLYPTAYTKDKKILIMSLDKFLLRYSTILEPSFFIYESNIIQDGVIFIDEFDSTKDVILNRIIQNGLDNQLGIIELFRDIYAGLFNTQFTKILTEESENLKRYPKLKTPEQILSTLQERASEIMQKYNLQYFHKLKDEFREDVSFLFQDYKIHTIVNGKNKNLLVETDQDTRVNWMQVVHFKQEEQKEDSIYSLINDLKGFLIYFQTGVGFIAKNYNDLKYDRKKDIYNISYEAAIRTVLSEFGMEGRGLNYLTYNIMSSARRKNFDWSHMEDILDFSVYEKGFRYYQIVDHDFYDTQSRINFIAFNDSPEKFICRLVNRTKVVGISATATLPSVLSNYDLNYIEQRCKGSVYRLNKDDKERLNQIFCEATSKYNNININCIALGDNISLTGTVGELYKFCIEKHGHLNDFLQKRFLCYAQALDCFFGNANIQSFLFFANSKGKEYNVDGTNLYYYLFDSLANRLKIKAKLYFLTGTIDYFERQKQNMLDDLKRGEKVFVISTYGSMGAGQNIHYEYSDDIADDLVQINELTYNLDKKDFDAVYLELPTHIIENASQGFDSDVSFIKYIYQIKFLEEVGDITANESEYHIRSAFRIKSGQKIKLKHPKESENYCLAYAKVALQAIGRICRTSKKQKDVYILYQDDLAERIKPITHHFSDRHINPEFAHFLKSCESYEINALTIPSSTELLKVKAENNIIQGAQIIENLRANWSGNHIERWEAIRDEVLKHPTLDCLADTDYPDLYIELPEPNDHYFIRQNNGAIEVSFTEKSNFNCVDTHCVYLPEILQIPGIADYFVKKGYAVNFESRRYMLGYRVLKKVYQGALGEVVGRYIINNWLLSVLGLKWENLPDDYYEKFDNRIRNIYFDFKHWSGVFNPTYRQEIKKIRPKINKVHPEKVVFVNILKPNGIEVKPYLESIQDPLLTIPYLYDLEKRVWNLDGMRILYQSLITIE